MIIKDKVKKIHETESLGSLGNTRKEKIAVYGLFLIISILIFSSFSYFKFLNNLENNMKSRYSGETGILFSIAYDGSDNNYKKLTTIDYSIEENTLSYITNGNTHILDFKIMVDILDEEMINNFYLNGYLFIDGNKVINEDLDFIGSLGKDFYGYKSQEAYEDIKNELDVTSRYKLDKIIVTFNKKEYLVLTFESENDNKLLVFNEDKLIYISDIVKDNGNSITEDTIKYISSCDENKCVEKVLTINNDNISEVKNEIDK